MKGGLAASLLDLVFLLIQTTFVGVVAVMKRAGIGLTEHL
jgi:hypothetical protein